MTKEEVCVGVDIAKSTLDVAVSDSGETRQFANDDEGISQAVRYVASLKPARVIIEATGSLEMPLAAALQADNLPVVVINPH
ncbi:transposase [Chloroflexota bacterium]